MAKAIEEKVFDPGYGRFVAEELETIRKKEQRAQIERFLDSGTFLDTESGPRFVKNGGTYYVMPGGLEGPGFKAMVECTTGWDGRPKVIFTPVDGSLPLPGPTKIFDVKEMG